DAHDYGPIADGEPLVEDPHRQPANPQPLRPTGRARHPDASPGHAKGEGRPRIRGNHLTRVHARRRRPVDPRRGRGRTSVTSTDRLRETFAGWNPPVSPRIRVVLNVMLVGLVVAT